MALYWFFAAAGVPLVVFFLLSGGADGIDDGIAGIMFRFLPLSSLAIAAATFGVCGLVLDATGNGARTTFGARPHLLLARRASTARCSLSYAGPTQPSTWETNS